MNDRALFFSLLIVLFGLNLTLNSNEANFDDDGIITDEESEILHEFNQDLENKDRHKRQTQDLLKTYIDNLKNVDFTIINFIKKNILAKQVFNKKGPRNSFIKWTRFFIRKSLQIRRYSH